MTNKILNVVAALVVILAGLVTFQNKQMVSVEQVFANHNEHHQQVKVRICHSTDSQSNPYTNPDVDQDAIDGDAGNDNGQGDHYLTHNGPAWYQGIPDHSWGDIIPPIAGVHGGKNWDTQGQAIWNNACSTVFATPSPSVDPSPTPTPGIGGPDPSPSPSEGRRSHIGYDASCNENFDVVMDLTDNGNPVANVVVTFKYNGHDTTATTNQDGRARVSYRKDGESTIKAEADGFPGADIFVTFRTDCPNTGSVLGATTDVPKKAGKVLGASTLANTGMADIQVAVLALGAGALLMVVSLRYYLVTGAHAQASH